MSGPRASRVFYGWYVVAAAFAVTFVGFGSAYTFSAFVEALQRDFAASRGQISLVFSLAGFLYFGFGIVSGPLADRFGSRRLAVTGMLLTAAGLAAAGAAHTLLQVYVAYGLGVGLGVGCAYVPAVGAVQRWFVRRRGFASGLAVAGIGVGTLVMPPLAAALIAHVGWRGAYFTLAALAVAIGAGMSLLIENDPRGRGLLPDGEAVHPAAGGGLPEAGGHTAGAPDSVNAADRARAAAAAPTGATLREAVTSRPFASLYAACLVCSFGVFVPFVHLVPYALDHGVASSTAVLLLGAIGVGSTAGRFFLGGLADRFGRRASLLAMFAGMAVALVAWAGAGSVATLATFALVFGVFYGGWVAVLPAVVMDYFGGRNVSAIIGVLYTSIAFGTLIGPAAAGFIYDAGGGYLVPILASAAANAIAFAIVATTGRAQMAVRAAGR
ncbi:MULTISPECIES: MFS transporter [unclassified Burkholderia]|uniref:MFS transporter n=1 Tax=unclassified Burkholderia TaxID=2613784 RepID=UPI000F577262|nr:MULTISPECIES: MFS transporter [unclassified Burkholderia]RQR38916.1 MFS transporter [Burkholderia sp. Bp9131]RQR69218.1 MFS transporter [Burkholderia sp. Bp9015]RQR93457.1 MFS transporter [Burkholderia sp. Bp8994]RQS27112.1 MFS transporter [Burkholderia sp. Bp8995]RQS37726.1 MFS transporter [Burkholderia sp. Bp8990]